MFLVSSLVTFFLITSSAAVPTRTVDAHNHDHAVKAQFATSWHHPEDHPVNALFKRAATDGLTYAQIGSPSWSAPYPTWTPDSNAMPAAWIDALNAAVAAGKIPNVPLPTQTAPNTNPIYPNNISPMDPNVCSATYKCRIPGDLWDAPAGVWTSTFDDGPSPSTPKLLQFLQQNNVSTTHFMIGVNILQNPNEFEMAFNAGNDIAVHTWTHPYMTTLNNMDVVAQLGWTMELIHNSTGGRVPRYWRPPYGDSDMRVRSIAKEVFGLETVIWNSDTEDWDGTHDSIVAALTGFANGPKSPGIIVLEHEIVDRTVDSFIDGYPHIIAAGWRFESFAKAINDGRTYQNAEGSDSSDVVAANILLDSSSDAGSSSTSTQPSTTAGPSSSTTSSLTIPTKNSNLAPNSTTPNANQEGSSVATTPYLATAILVIASAFALLA